MENICFFESGIIYLLTSGQDPISLLTSLFLTLAPPIEVNAHSQLLQPVLSTHKMRVYSYSTRATAHGTLHMAHTPDRQDMYGYSNKILMALRMDCKEDPYDTWALGFD